MQIVGRIFKEILIAVILLGLLFLVGFILFRNQFTFLSSDIPNPVTYKGIEAGEYDIKGDLEDQKDPTKTYQNTPSTLKYLEESRRVHTGTPNPFSGALDEDSDTDLPSEKVDIQNQANPSQNEMYYYVSVCKGTPYGKNIFHIGVGSSVVCSTTIGNARTSIRGMDNRTIPRFFVYSVEPKTLLT